jgi:hypothetical protein
MNQTWISFPGRWVLTASISAAKFFNRYALTVRPIADSLPLDNAFRIEASSRDLRSCVAVASVVIQATQAE